MQNEDIGFISLNKRKENDTYIFFYEEEHTDALFDEFLRYAEDKELNFDYSDAETLIERITQLRKKSAVNSGLETIF